MAASSGEAIEFIGGKRDNTAENDKARQEGGDLDADVIAIMLTRERQQRPEAKEREAGRQ